AGDAQRWRSRAWVGETGGSFYQMDKQDGLEQDTHLPRRSGGRSVLARRRTRRRTGTREEPEQDTLLPLRPREGVGTGLFIRLTDSLSPSRGGLERDTHPWGLGAGGTRNEKRRHTTFETHRNKIGVKTRGTRSKDSKQ